MHLRKITLHDFKNISDASLEFSPKFNLISGNNGAGKTNLLDAVYYLSMTKSFFSTSDQYVYAFGKEEAIASGLYVMDDGCEERVAVAVRKGGKQFQRGGKPYERLSDHVGLVPVVMVSPADTSLINDSGEERRKYLNSILSQTDREYLRHIQQYNQLLLRRNHLLKEGSPSLLLLETISERMEPHAAYVHESRSMLCSKLQPIISEFYALVSGNAEEVSLEYRSDLEEATLTELLARDAERDRILRFTSSGIQRDEVSFGLGGHPLRKCGSQGQQKTFLLALKLAQFTFMKDNYGLTPILLLDDVFDKLDMGRVESLLSVVARDDFGQIFITDSNKVRISETMARLEADRAEFFVSGGKIERL